MKSLFRASTIVLGAGIWMAAFISGASASCGDLSSLQGPFKFAAPAQAQPQQPAADGNGLKQRGASAPSMVGFWKVQFISRGNTTHNPSIPDGALIDFGFTQWHSDGTEILNSGGHSPASGNWCLGVWGQTGYLTYELNHFPIAYDPATGTIVNYLNIREQDTLSPSGDSYSGTFTIDIYDPQGNHVDHLGGTMLGTRLTVDTTIPDAIPSN